MDVATLLTELYGRIPPLVREAVEGLGPDDLLRAPRSGANPIGWLGWHIGRVLDHQIAELVPEPQLWVTGDRASQFGLEPDPSNTGFGHDADDVAGVQPRSATAIVEYVDAVGDRARAYLRTLDPHDLDRVVDEAWDPPVTLGVRLVSVADDCLQHAGQAAYARGLLTS